MYFYVSRLSQTIYLLEANLTWLNLSNVLANTLTPGVSEYHLE